MSKADIAILIIALIVVIVILAVPFIITMVAGHPYKPQ